MRFPEVYLRELIEMLVQKEKQYYSDALRNRCLLNDNMYATQIKEIKDEIKKTVKKIFK